MKLSHPKIIVAALIAITVIIAILNLPIMPYSIPGAMGGGFTSLSEKIQTPYPENQPDHLPVYKVTDFVSIVKKTANKYDFKGDILNQTETRTWMANILEKEFNLPLPDGPTIPKYIDPEGPDGPTYHSGLNIYSKIDNMVVWPFNIFISTTNDFKAKSSPKYKDTNLVGYENYKLTKVGEAKILSAQEAHKLLNKGNDISIVSRALTHEKSGQMMKWEGMPVTSVKLEWYYPPAVETDWNLKCDYLIPVWLFRNPNGYGCINAFDGDIVIDWSPEGKPNFTPNEKFEELKNIKPKKWIVENLDKDVTEREADIYLHKQN